MFIQKTVLFFTLYNFINFASFSQTDQIHLLGTTTESLLYTMAFSEFRSINRYNSEPTYTYFNGKVTLIKYCGEYDGIDFNRKVYFCDNYVMKSDSLSSINEQYYNISVEELVRVYDKITHYTKYKGLYYFDKFEYVLRIYLSNNGLATIEVSNSNKKILPKEILLINKKYIDSLRIKKINLDKNHLEKNAISKNTKNNQGGLEFGGCKALFTISKDKTNEVGKIVFLIKVDERGQLLSINPIEKTVSPKVVEFYKNQIAENWALDCGGGNTVLTKITTGKYTIYIR